MNTIIAASLTLEPQTAGHAEEMSAVLGDPENARSLRLLVRLAFSPASPAEHARHDVEPGELLVHREVPSRGPSSGR